MMATQSRLLCLLTIFAALVSRSAQQDSLTPQNICSELIENANATGGEHDNKAVGQINQMGRWTVSVISNYSAGSIDSAESVANENVTDAVANIWLDPYEKVDLNDGSNSYSSCAYIAQTLPENTIRRGQEDDTSCYQTFSKECVEAITSQVAEVAHWLTISPTLGPYNNLTPPILGAICDKLVGELNTSDGDNYPPSCAPYFVQGKFGEDGHEYPAWNRLQMTGNVTRPKNCTFSDTHPGSHLLTADEYNSPPGNRMIYNGTSPANAYDTMVHQVWPILTVLMPPANNSRQSSISEAYAHMTCIRASNISPGSRTPPALPAADAVKFPRSGSYYGIRVGVPIALIVLAVIAGVGAWYVWRKKKNNKAAAAGAAPDLSKSESKDAVSYEIPLKGGGDVYQLPDDHNVQQLQGDHKVEMSADGMPRWAHGFDGKPQELTGSDSVPTGHSTRGS